MKRIRKTSCVFVALALQAMACSAETNGPDDPRGASTAAAGGDGGRDGDPGAPVEGPSGTRPGNDPGPMGRGGSDPQSTGGNGGSETGGRPPINGEGGNPTGAAGSGAGGTPETVQPRAFCPQGPFEANPIPMEPQIQELCKDYPEGLSEGPVWLAGPGVLYFSHKPRQTTDVNIVSYAPGGSCQTHITNAGTEVLAIGADGALLGGGPLTQTIASFDLVTKVRTEVVLSYMGEKLQDPQDLAVSSRGHLYFLSAQGVFWRDPEGNLTLVEALAHTKGITLSPDGSRLFVSVETGVHAFEVDATGKPSQPTPFVAIDTFDGRLVSDCAGNLYMTRGIKVHVYDGAGQPKGEVAFSTIVLNLAFGGTDQKTLFVTTSRGIQSVQLNVPGLPY